jgi:hypothetical protein
MTGLIPVEYSSLRVDRSSWRCRSWTSGRPSRRTGKWGRLQTLETPAVDFASVVGWKVLLGLREEIGLAGMRLLQERRLALLLVLEGRLSFPRKEWRSLCPCSLLDAGGLGCHCEAVRMLAESSQGITSNTAPCGETVSDFGQVVAKRGVGWDSRRSSRSHTRQQH